MQWDPIPLENALSATVPAAMVEYDNGNTEPFKALQIATTDPFIKIGGWCFDMRPYLRKYWVKTKYYGIREYFAINKTAIRSQLKSDCLKIVEV